MVERGESGVYGLRFEVKYVSASIPLVAKLCELVMKKMPAMKDEYKNLKLEECKR